MKIINKKINQIKKNNNLNNYFTSITHKDLNIECNFLNNNFYLDSLNYFPITQDNLSFLEIFSWGNTEKYSNFYTTDFVKNFDYNKKNFKTISNAFVLGSSSNDNYYRNMITFLPRIFFNKDKKIKLVLHRSSSNKLRDFIKSICKKMKVEVQFIFLDDDFYKFINCQLPQFLNKFDSVKILNNFKIVTNEPKNKLYIRRQNCSFRNLINESDIINILKQKGYKPIDLSDVDILDQIKLFSNAESIVSATGSALTNLVFCNPGTKVYEISPKYEFKYEENFENRFKFICKTLKLNYTRISADSIDVDPKKIGNKIKNTISKKVLDESYYYKNLLVKIEDFNKAINS